jgi:beta-1,2-mannobiose phosphorylase / 1,2-beta-oligomannan phosphorylase
MQEIQAHANLPSALKQPYMLRRLNIVMRPREGDPLEEGGVLNPGGARARNGDYLLFPRLVARGNYSRIGVARVQYDANRLPIGVERLGVALEPREPYELNPRSGGGCEDSRVTYVPSLDTYVMTYVAYGPLGPRAAVAVSTDLHEWRRVGLINFAPHHGADMNIYSNKDALLFPEPVIGPDGRPSLALLHRPMYEIWTGKDLDERVVAPLPPGTSSDIWTIWISFCPLENADWADGRSAGKGSPPAFGNHHLLVLPERAWESIRLGGGTPPIRLPEGWFTIYHGIGGVMRPGPQLGLRYVAAALVLDVDNPCRILYRSPQPILEPALREECSGVVADVVFPTAVDQREDYLDVYYGMADACIGTARMDLASG